MWFLEHREMSWFLDVTVGVYMGISGKGAWSQEDLNQLNISEESQFWPQM